MIGRLGIFLALSISFLAGQSLASCRLSRLEWMEQNSWGSCLQADISLFSKNYSGENGKHASGLAWSEVYGSVFARPWLSLHLKAFGGRTDTNGTNQGDDATWNRTTEQFFLQMGHPLQSQVYGAVGRVPLPFGINDVLGRHSLDSRAEGFWDRSATGTRISFLIREDLRGEFGAAWTDEEDVFNSRAEVLSGRLTKLTDLLNGTKLVASYQALTDNSLRKYGLGTIVYHDENRTSLEWVRLTYRDKLDDFQQVFRLVHRQVAHPVSWDFQYEDIRRDSYRLSLQVNRELPLVDWSPCTLTGGVHYERLRRAKAVHQGYLLLGLTFGLATSLIDEGA